MKAPWWSEFFAFAGFAGVIGLFLSSFGSPPWPFVLVVSSILFCSIGFYFISKGVDGNFNALQIGAGLLLLLIGGAFWISGIIHGELVPKWLAITENASTTVLGCS